MAKLIGIVLFATHFWKWYILGSDPNFRAGFNDTRGSYSPQQVRRAFSWTIGGFLIRGSDSKGHTFWSRRGRLGPHLFLLMVSAPFRRFLVLGSVKIGQAWTCAWNCGSSLFYQHTFETGRIYPASYSRINLEETAEEVPTWAAANTQGFWPPNKCSF